MEESILTSIKKILGIGEDDEDFDTDIIMHINTVLFVLTQLGVGPVSGFYINDDSAKWSDFLPNNMSLESVKSYIGMKVKILFDPPLASAVIDSMNRVISEFEWRLNVAVDPKEENQNG